MSRSRWLVNPLTFTLLQSSLAGVALAQPESDVERLLEEVVVTGTRKEGQSPTETLSPIDVLGGAALANQAAFDLTDGLTKIAPSINTQRFPIADGTAFIRPVTLRNLSPDQTLVMVNGSRRHRSALVNLQLAPLGTVNQGAQAVDFSTLPAAAIKRIEVLRDGASAQYGSDAIAGVINVILKDDNEGFSVSGQYGEYSEGDGERFTASANAGFPLGSEGFINATIEYSTADTTSRGVPHADAAAVGEVVGPGVVPLGGLGQRWGDPEVEATKLFINSAVAVGPDVELYGHASYMDNETVSDFFYRVPVLDPSAQIAARNTLQSDSDGDFLPDPAPQSLVDAIAGGGLNPADYLVPSAQVPGTTSASGFVLRNPIYTLFPGGYNPTFGAEITDYAVALGLRGESVGDFRWDVRGRLGENEVTYALGQSINPSLGRLSPTTFTPGTLTQEEIGFNADFVQPVEMTALVSPLNIAFGIEYREESYKISAGDTASIVAGPTAAIFGVGSDGFQGFPADSAGTFDSESIAVYIDLEADLTDRLSAGAALRYEDFEEFGSTTDWKLSARFALTDDFALRATANTGFRAPTPGQVNTLNVTTTANAAGALIPNGTYPVTNPVAIALGSRPLTPEESTSFTLGAVLTPWENTSITLDYYDITIEDRIALQNNAVGAAEVALLSAAGVPNAELLLGSNANFFTNAFESNVSGVDLAVTYDIFLANGSLNLDLRHNFNQQEVKDIVTNTIDGSRAFDLEHQTPENRTTFTANYTSDSWFGGYVRLNWYDDWETTGGLFGPGDASDRVSYGGDVLVDVEANISTPDNRYALAIGAENLFDIEPGNEQNGTLQFLGDAKALTSPFGFNGAFWYLRVSASF